MADKTIGSLTKAASLQDDSMFVMEQQGEAMSLSGAQIREFAEKGGYEAAKTITKGEKGDPGDISLLDARSADYDMDVILKSGAHCAFYKTNDKTLNTPQSLLGLGWGRATIFSCAVQYSTYGCQLAFIDGNAGMYYRAVNGGTISQWQKVHHDGMSTLLMSGGLAKLLKTGNLLQFSNYNEAGVAAYARHLLLYNGVNSSGSDTEALQMWSYDANGTVSKYRLFGEHNKPTGTYTGNGDATSRTIDTGGIGNFVVIWCGYGKAILTPVGGLTFNSSAITNIPAAVAKITDGVITIASDNISLNRSGTTHTYQVL